MTSIEALEFLRKDFPEVPNWLCWQSACVPQAAAIGKIPVDSKQSGRIGDWSWTRVESSYPALSYWSGNMQEAHRTDGWTGVLNIRGPNGTDFLLLSYLSSLGTVGGVYMSSAGDLDLLVQFAKDVSIHLGPKQDVISVTVIGGKTISLRPEEDERIIMPEGIIADIETHLDSFFARADSYRSLEIPHRRGFLLVGPPGTGKTMMIRRLIRRAWKKCRPSMLMLKPSSSMDDGVLDIFFQTALDESPSIVILEDVDALARETEVTRAGLLSHLDGLEPREGILVLATTNNPRDVDPALIHRPSRFDRVWLFDLPDCALRKEYLAQAFRDMADMLVSEIAGKTAGWSYAYLNELRVTAAVVSAGQNRTEIREDALVQAYDLLAAQFRAGKKNYAVSHDENDVGFKVA